jgi:hypothetical protein
MRKIIIILSATLCAALLGCLIFAACTVPEDDRDTYTVTFVAKWYEKVGSEEWGKWEKFAGEGFEDWQMEWEEDPPGIGEDDDGNVIGDIEIWRTVGIKKTQRTDTLGRISKIPRPPDREDYEFIGWFTSGNTPVSIRTVFTTDTIVLARWKAGENIQTVERGPVAREFTRIRNEVLAGGKPTFSYIVKVEDNETILPQTLDYNGRIVYIVLEGNTVAPPVISVSGMGSLFEVGGNVTLELRNIWLRGGARNPKGLLTVNSGGRIIIGQNAADKTLIFNNLAEDNEDGGGVSVKGGELIMNGGEISENLSLVTAGEIGYRGIGGGGVNIRNGGIFTMNGGRIRRNQAEDGGAVMVYRYGKFIMNGGELYDNTSYTGGGVHVYRGLFEMRGGKIHSNMAGDGGAVYVNRGLTDIAHINDYDPRKPDSPENNPATKQGFYMYGGEISNNGSNMGGAIFTNWGSFSYMGGGIITGNTAYESGAIHHLGLFIMANGTISKNKATYLGGVEVAEGVFIMENGKITENESSNSGGGVYVSEYFIMYGGEITANKADGFAGGVCILPTGSFAMSGGLIEGNSGNRPEGGGTLYFATTDVLDMTAKGTAYYGIRGEGADYVDAYVKRVEKTNDYGPYYTYEITSYLDSDGYDDDTKIEVIDGVLRVNDVIVPKAE